MAQFTIPTSPGEPFYSQTTSLDGVEYLLEFVYCQREALFYLNMSLADGTPLAMGLKVVANRRLLGMRTDSRLPPGDVVALCTTQDTSPPGLDELGLGLRCELVYLDASEFATGSAR